MSRRLPALFTFLSLAAGIAAAGRLDIDLVYILPVFVTLAVLTIIFAKARTSAILALAVIFLAGYIRYSLSFRYLPENHISHLNDKNAELIVEGRVADFPVPAGRYFKHTIVVDSVFCGNCSSAASGKILARLPKKFRYGDLLRLKGRIYSPYEPTSFGVFDYRRYLAMQGIHSIITIKDTADVMLAGRGVGPRPLCYLWLAASSVRDWVRKVFSRYLSGDYLNFILGIFLGERAFLSKEMTSHFVNAGVIHILAVSGLHVGFVVFLLIYIFSMRLPLPKKISTLLVMVFLLFYTVLVGARPSVKRAAIIACCLLLSNLVERKADLLNLLGFSGIIILAIWPGELFTAGFLLSFAAVFGIVYIYPKIAPDRPNARNKGFFYKWVILPAHKWVISPFFVSLSATVSTVPIVAFYFRRLQIVAPLANLAVIPLAGIALYLAFPILLFGSFCHELGSVFAASLWGCEKALFEITKFFASLSFSYTNIPHPRWWLIFLFFAMLVLVVELIKKRLVRVAVILLLATLLVLSCIGINRGFFIAFLDVGQGDSSILHLPSGRLLIVDAGIPRMFDYVIKPFLDELGAPGVELAVMTHPDFDHIGGFLYMLRTSLPDTIFYPGVDGESRTYREIKALIEEKDIDYVKLSRGDTLPISPARGIVLSPDSFFVSRDGRVITSNNNDASVVIKILYKDVSFLLTGDASVCVEHHLVDEMPDNLHSTVLKLGHHGSRTSSSREFLTAVSPAFAIISCGRSNRYGHPHREVTARLDSLGIIYLRTDREGTIIMKTDGRVIEVKSFKRGKIYRLQNGDVKSLSQ